eukprot:gene26241-34863_t
MPALFARLLRTLLQRLSCEQQTRRPFDLIYDDEMREVAHQMENTAHIVKLLSRRAPVVSPFVRDAAPRIQLPFA